MNATEGSSSRFSGLWNWFRGSISTPDGKQLDSHKNLQGHAEQVERIENAQERALGINEDGAEGWVVIGQKSPESSTALVPLSTAGSGKKTSRTRSVTLHRKPLNMLVPVREEKKIENPRSLTPYLEELSPKMNVPRMITLHYLDEFKGQNERELESRFFLDAIGEDDCPLPGKPSGFFDQAFERALSVPKKGVEWDAVLQKKKDLNV